jgi:hypothetical protein
MQHLIQTSTSRTPEIVEIQLWGLYLLINHADLYREMIGSSLDSGPVEKNPQAPGRVTFRFDVTAWESKIKKLLYAHRVPVIMKSEMPVTTSYRSSVGILA